MTRRAVQAQGSEPFFSLDSQSSGDRADVPVRDQPFDYGDYKEAASGSNVLTQLAAMAHEQKQAEADVARLEDELKAAKEKLKFISESKIPNFMEANEMRDYTTKDGLSVEINELIRGSIPKATEAKAFAWLEENNSGHLIKRQFIIEFGKDEEAWAKKFMADLAKRKRQLNHPVKRAVPPQTLQAVVREALGNGVAIPMEVFGVHRQRVAKVTVK